MLCQSISLASPFASLPRAPRTRAALPRGSRSCISKRPRSGGAAPVSAQVSMPKGGAPVQALYELCRKTFSASGTPASSQAITKLCSLLDTIGPTDVGLKEDNAEDDRGHGFFGQGFFRNHHSNRVARWAQPITYLHIYECDSFTIGIFCLPTSAVIPLHDHPGMTVLSKLLYGCMHVKAFDWVEPASVQSSSKPEYFSAPGNGTYEPEEDYAWLQAIKAPDDLHIRSGKYEGPAVQDTEKVAKERKAGGCNLL